MGETLGALAVAVHAGVFVPPSQARPGLPPAVDAWMARALHIDPANRFGSAKELAEALDQALGGAEGGRPAMASVESLDAVPLVDSGARGLERSDAHARTFQGMAATGPGHRARRGPAVLVAIALGGLASVGSGVFVATRGSPVDESGRTQEGLPGASAAASTPSAAGNEATPLERGTAAEPDVRPTASARPPAPSWSASPSTSAASTALPAGSASTAPASSAVRPRGEAAPGPARGNPAAMPSGRRGGDDDVGF